MIHRALACLPLAATFAFFACGDETSDDGTSPAAGCEASAGCPSVVSECIAFADNASKDKFALRISHLSISTPTALTDPTVSALLAKGIFLNYPQCTAATGDAIFTGDGTFSWILEFDKVGGQLKTGGARLETDPTAGYCFVNETVAGFPVSPLEVAVPIGADGAFETATTKAVTVPIYTDPTDASKVIILPLRGVRIFDGKVSADNNCIGTYNAANLDPNNLCKEEPGAVPLFVDGAALEGHITLEEADSVLIPELSNKTLCWLLATGTHKDMATGKCTRDGTNKITMPGDWCTGATPDDPGVPGGCGDSVKLGATFAASGATVRADCP